jgi:hypothetical protein
MSSNSLGGGRATGNQSTGLPRVHTSPVILTEAASGDDNLISSAAASVQPPRSSDPTRMEDSHTEDDEDDSFSSSSTAATAAAASRRLPSWSSPSAASSYHGRHPTRRERSLSSVANPAASAASSYHHHRSSSAVLDLDYTSLEAKTKRRSVSTYGTSNISVSPTPIKTARSSDSSSTMEAAEPLLSSAASTASLWASEKLPPTNQRVSRLAKVGGGHVRFEENPTKCHHLLSDEGSDRWTPSGGPQQPLQQPLQQPQGVQRTHSNPEMELCPVCLARKECEILLKRTYSKVRNW